MARNVLIFSDGTGQAGGLFVEERRSNVYKLYRATRCAPDSSVDPAGQAAFYDPRLGSRPSVGGLMRGAFRALHNFLSQATGYGLTTNIIDCVEAIYRLWQPGDRIFLFGSAAVPTPLAAWAAFSPFAACPRGSQTTAP